ncbi:hypothetical protein JQX09_11780 [Sulfitobacter pseudonitzschiae]|uniref:Uncharacterized protein n=1 Tax=Pseudosulfitobacter pseudonitzschiae TaxID=1402135 RepID=A0A9Q2NPK3_9RHOB|nr:hypothetical protein [Pseudosulfitobacter pseudonitzschiae]MBM2292598.1 hypothetical protein [Pseudosulfitobacter pseudonitzschiae]MBM2297515.1 hypothetical protein [Pseudosulfitobacter pseudonitzschiae]MBM2302429.1 hypothetical protein [Pseudosulfitobacter pseudonitzschiae]MBM2312212.1 hypothetical protein [Pseudosulfitobacter pseudonitzschiae]MBM2317125.1 hypothetical protein [Pseudosulfitobacter pseudonitzschiae]
MKRFFKKTAFDGHATHAKPSRIKCILAALRPVRGPHISKHLARDAGIDAATHARLTHRWPSQGPAHPRW